MHPADALVGVGDGMPDGCGWAVPREVGHGCGQDGNVAQEAGQRDVADGGVQGLEAGGDAGGAGGAGAPDRDPPVVLVLSGVGQGAAGAGIRPVRASSPRPPTPRRPGALDIG
ncbi:hypothetical protein SHO565_70620 [Streptomyces sp. HO565]